MTKRPVIDLTWNGKRQFFCGGVRAFLFFANFDNAKKKLCQKLFSLENYVFQ